MSSTTHLRPAQSISQGVPRHSHRARFTEHLRDAGPAILGYTLVRALGLLTLAIFAAREGRSVGQELADSDGVWYLGIADQGYDTSITYEGDRLKNTNIAFFPLFPLLIRVLAALGIPSLHAGLVIAFLAGIAAAWAIFLIGVRLGGTRSFGVVLAVLWGIVPHSVVQNMVYTESLFTALCAWSLWAVLERRWVLAGALTLSAGLTRPTAVVLVATVGLACLVEIVRRRDGWRPFMGAALAPLGLVGFYAWCATVMGRIDAWFWMQREGWGTYVDYGRLTIKTVIKVLTQEQKLAIQVTTAVLAIAALLLLLLILGRQAPWPVILFATLLVGLTLLQGGGYYHAKARFLMAAFPLLIPIAAGLAQARPHVRYVVLSGLALVSAWYGTYLLLVWPYSP